MKKSFNFFFGIPDQISSLHTLREKLLNAMLLSSLVLGTILFGLALIPAIQKGVYLSILTYIALYLLMILTTFVRQIPYRWRVFYWCCMIYVLGVVNLAMNGLNVDGGLFFLTLISMAALFGGIRNGFIALGVSFSTIFIAGEIIVNYHLKLSMSLPQTDPILWIIGCTVFLVMGLFLMVSLTTLVRGLDASLVSTTTLAEDLRKVNETLQKSDERFRALLEGSSDIISVLAVDGTIRYMSPSAEGIMGYKAEALLGLNVFDFIHPDDHAIAFAALTPGTPAEEIGPFLELRFHHQNGSWRYLEVKGRELHIVPSIDGTVVNCRDITDRKEIEENLRKSQLLLEKTFSSLNDALFLIDPRLARVMDCNRAAMKIFGYEREEIIGQQIDIFMQDEYISARDEYIQNLDANQEDLTMPERFEAGMRRKNGEIFPGEFSIAPIIDTKSGLIGWVCLVHDITIRKRAEQQLLKAKDELEQRVVERTAEVERTSKQLRELVAHSPAVIYSASIAGDLAIPYVTENVSALTGYPAANFFEDAYFWKSLIHPADLEHVSIEIDAARASDAVVFDYRFKHKKGEYRWARDEMKMVRDLDGKPKEFVGSWVDITEQRLAESALRESEETNRVILNSTSASIALLDPDGILLSINDPGAESLGKNAKEIIGSCVYDLFPPEVAKTRRVLNKKVFNTGKPVHYEDFRDGRWFDNSVYPVFHDSKKVNRLVVHAINITESKRIQDSLHQSEERYRTLAEASPDLIFIIGPDDRVEYINSFAAGFLQLPIHKIIGQPREQFFPSMTNDHQKHNIFRVLEDGKNTYAENETWVGERVIWLGTWLVPLRDGCGRVSGVLGISRDITAQKQAEMEILRSRDQLEERVRERTAELIASQNQLRQLTSQLVTAQEEERRRISRELHDEAGQALISLKYSLASLASEIPGKNISMQQRLADSIKVSDQMMTQIRTLAHSLRPPVLEIGGINLSLKDYCDEFTERTGLKISYQGEEIPNLPDEIGISLYRFVQETLTNILKHAHATKVTIKLQYRKKQIELSVTDNGLGMENNSQSDGIGLLGVEERFNLIGGYVDIHSRKGKGVKAMAYVPWPKNS